MDIRFSNSGKGLMLDSITSTAGQRGLELSTSIKKRSHEASIGSPELSGETLFPDPGCSPIFKKCKQLTEPQQLSPSKEIPEYVDEGGDTEEEIEDTIIEDDRGVMLIQGINDINTCSGCLVALSEALSSIKSSIDALHTDKKICFWKTWKSARFVTLKQIPQLRDIILKLQEVEEFLLSGEDLTSALKLMGEYPVLEKRLQQLVLAQPSEKWEKDCIIESIAMTFIEAALFYLNKENHSEALQVKSKFYITKHQNEAEPLGEGMTSVVYKVGIQESENQEIKTEYFAFKPENPLVRENGAHPLALVPLKKDPFFPTTLANAQVAGEIASILGYVFLPKAYSGIYMHQQGYFELGTFSTIVPGKSVKDLDCLEGIDLEEARTESMKEELEQAVIIDFLMASLDSNPSNIHCYDSPSKQLHIGMFDSDIACPSERMGAEDLAKAGLVSHLPNIQKGVYRKYIEEIKVKKEDILAVIDRYLPGERGVSMKGRLEELISDIPKVDTPQKKAGEAASYLESIKEFFPCELFPSSPNK